MTIHSKILTKIISFCHHHKNEPTFPELPICDCYMSETDIQEQQQQLCLDNIQEWNLNFFDVELGILFDILSASNYLDIPFLYKEACKIVAKMIHGKSKDEIRNTFMIKDMPTKNDEKKYVATSNDKKQDMKMSSAGGQIVFFKHDQTWPNM